MNRGPSVGMVPAEDFAFFFAANDPAIAIGIAWAKRPKNIAISRRDIILGRVRIEAGE